MGFRIALDLRWSLPLALVVSLGACVEWSSSPLQSLAEEESRPTAQSSCLSGLPAAILPSQLDGLQGQVDLLIVAGAVNRGQGNALSNHLANARRLYGQGSNCAAAAALNAFRQQVDNFVTDGVLTDREAYELRYRWRLLTTPPSDARDPADAETYAPGVAGEPRSRMIGGEEFRYEVIDGLAIFTGDIILGYADEFEASILPAGGPALVGPCNQSDAGCADWTDGIIGYDFARDWGDFSANQVMIDRILAAINHWRDLTGLRFELRTTGERVIFRNSTGCSSWVGRQVVTVFDPQSVNLSMDCDLGSVIHEIGHAVGIYHEQSRNDRSDFIRVNYDVIEFDAQGNFFQFLGFGQDIGAYDYTSIMHYHCNAFRIDGATRSPIEILDPAFTCGFNTGQMGQRVGLSEGDILGAYWLYRPQYEIVGAEGGETRDRFELTLDFDTEPVADEFIHWTVDRDRLSTGPTFSSLELGLWPGNYTIGAEIRIADVLVARRSVRVTIANEAPQVDLGPDRDVDLRRTFALFADVTDAEDGTCPPSVCTYTWSPRPNVSDRGGAAEYRFEEEGPQTISVTVRDGAGATTTDAVTVNVVNSPPVVAFEAPAPGSVFNPGGDVILLVRATDANDGEGPGQEPVDCNRVRWSLSDRSDRLPRYYGCSVPLWLGDNPGERTITVTATDQDGLASSATLTVVVAECGRNCPPEVGFLILTAPDVEGTGYDPAVPGGVFYLDTPLRLLGSFADAEGNYPVILEWSITPPCFIGPSCPEPIRITGTIEFAPGTDEITWIPSTHVEPWGNCTSVPLPFVLGLRATDDTGASRIFRQTVYLACGLI